MTTRRPGSSPLRRTAWMVWSSMASVSWKSGTSSVSTPQTRASRRWVWAEGETARMGLRGRKRATCCAVQPLSVVLTMAAAPISSAMAQLASLMASVMLPSTWGTRWLRRHWS